MTKEKTKKKQKKNMYRTTSTIEFSCENRSNIYTKREQEVQRERERETGFRNWHFVVAVDEI